MCKPVLPPFFLSQGFRDLFSPPSGQRASGPGDNESHHPAQGHRETSSARENFADRQAH